MRVFKKFGAKILLILTIAISCTENRIKVGFYHLEQKREDGRAWSIIVKDSTAHIEVNKLANIVKKFLGVEIEEIAIIKDTALVKIKKGPFASSGESIETSALLTYMLTEGENIKYIKLESSKEYPHLIRKPLKRKNFKFFWSDEDLLKEIESDSEALMYYRFRHPQ